MKSDQEFDRVFRQEFRESVPNIIWKNDNGVYEVFGKYKIIPGKQTHQVLCWDNKVGIFNSTRTALSWCIADKFKAFNVARELLETDNKLGYLNNDIAIRANIADNSNKPEFRESIGTKLETKIIRKKQLENQLTKCVNLAKYWQQRGFNNETARTGRNQPNKTSR